MIVHTAKEKPKPKPRSGVIKPRKLKWHHRLSAWAIYLLVSAIAVTLRYRWMRPPTALSPEGRPYIFCIWHNRLSLALTMYKRYLRTFGGKPAMAAIVSASGDGGIVARALELFGVEPVRGSSSRRGSQALLEMTSWIERGYDVSITPDGPRGPRYVIQPGVIALAQLTGRPIVPAVYYLQWKKCLNSWDRFQIPIPFSKVEVSFGDPISVPRELTEVQREQYRQLLQDRLLQLTRDE